MSVRIGGTAAGIRLTWEIDRDGKAAFAEHEGYDLAAIRDASDWLWIVYRAYDDGDEDDTVAEGRAVSGLDAIERAEAAAMQAVEQDRTMSAELGEDFAARPSYRIYFRDRAGRIVGRDDFAAEDDLAAMAIAQLLRDACSDVCETFDLWRGTRHVDGSFGIVARPSESATEITARMQESLIEREEALQRSRWTIARSKRLLERLHVLAEQTAPGLTK